MADIFSRTISYGNAYSPDGMAITFSNVQSGLIVASIQWEYAQEITRIYDLSSAKVYLFVKRPVGKLTMVSVIGPAVLTQDFFDQYGDVCNAGDNTIDLNLVTGCGDEGGGTSQTLKFNNAVIERITGEIRSENMVIANQVDFTFISLSLTTS